MDAEGSDLAAGGRSRRVVSLSPAPEPLEHDHFDVVLPERPYPGLRPFEAREWPIFFGRERMADEVVARLIRDQFVVVHGDSGCGKSSLIRAGVLPRLEQESARGGLSWRTVTTQPRNAPLELLAEVLATLDGRAGDELRITEIRRILNFGADAAAALATLLRRGPADHLCVLIDQFEELFAFARREGGADARLYVQVLVGLVEQPPPGLYIALTMRSEFLGACARFPGLAEAVNRGQYLLPRMTHADLIRAIREPAALYGGSVAPALADRLILDSGGTQDQLPLIQHGLLRLVQNKDITAEAGWQLTLEDYQAIGNLADALSKHADEVLTSVEREPFPMAEQLFRALTEINAEGQAIRRPRTLTQLAAVSAQPGRAAGTHAADIDSLKRILDGFRAEGASFITPFGTSPLEPDTLIDITHEALIRCWDRVANRKTGWLVTEFQDGLIWRSLLVQAAAFERDDDQLLSLSTAEEQTDWMAHRTPAWSERYGGGADRVERLLQASLRAGKAAEREQIDRRRRRDRNLRALGVSIGAVALVFIALYVWAQQALDRANVASADSLWSRLDFVTEGRLQDDELNALWETRLADSGIVDAFFTQLTTRADRLLRFARRPQPIARALGAALPPERATALRDAVLRETAVDTPDFSRFGPAIEAAAGWMTPLQARDLFVRMLQSATRGEASYAALAALAARVEPADSVALLDSTVNALAGDPAADAPPGGYGEALGGPAGEVIRAVASRLPDTETASTFDNIMAKVSPPVASATTGASVASNRSLLLAPAASALARRLPGAQADERLLATVDLIARTPTSASLATWQTIAVALAQLATPAGKAQALERIVAEIRASADEAEAFDFVGVTATLASGMTDSDIQRITAPIATDFKASSDVRQLNRLVLSTAPFLARLSADSQQLVLSHIVRVLPTLRDSETINLFAGLIGIRATVLTVDDARRVMPALFAAAPYVREDQSVDGVAEATRAIVARLAPADGQQQMATVIRHIQATIAPGELNALGVMLPGTAAVLPADAAGRMLPELWAWITATTDVAQLRALSLAVPALASRLTADNGRRSLPGCMRYLMGTRDPDQIGALALAARTLAELIPEAERPAALTPLRPMVTDETDPDRLARLSTVIPPMAPGLDNPSVVLRHLVTAIENTLYAEQLALLRDAAAAVIQRLEPATVEPMVKSVALSLSTAEDADRIDTLTGLLGMLGERRPAESGDLLRSLAAWSQTPDQASAATRAFLARQPSSDSQTRLAALIEILKYPTAAGDATNLILDAIKTIDANAPGSTAGLDANLRWLSQAYPSIHINNPPACPPPILATHACP